MHIRTGVGTLLGAILVLLATSVPVLAQGSAPAGRGFVGGFGGATFGTAEPGIVFGARTGVEIVPGLHIIAEIGRLNDVLPTDVRDELDFVESLLELELGMPVTIDLTAPATYGLFGARWSRHTGRVSPFVEGGIGAAKVTIDFDEVSVGGIDVTSIVRDEIGAENLESTELLIGLGGGVNAEITSAASVDIGYRFSRITTEDPAIDLSMFYGMFVYSWR